VTTESSHEADHAEDRPVDDRVAEAQEAIQDARQRLAEVPAEVVVTNHVMGLYELAAIHLAAPEPNLPAAALAIDAVACLVDGLGDRIGENARTLRDALANIRMAFVQIKSAQSGSTTEG
jgi:chemotaxis regulatin CheY-phosphate phosphatase CheZ